MVVKRRSSVWQFLTIAILIGSLVLIWHDAKLGLLLLGSLAIVVSLLIELNSAKIWRGYKRNYQPSRSRLMTTLIKPREIYHTLNVYILWPVVLGLGIWAVYSALHFH